LGPWVEFGSLDKNLKFFPKKNMSEVVDEGKEVEDFIDELYQRFLCIFDNIKDIQDEIKLRGVENHNIQESINQTIGEQSGAMEKMIAKIDLIEEKRELFHQRNNSDLYDRVDAQNPDPKHMTLLPDVDKEIFILHKQNAEKSQILTDLQIEEQKFRSEIDHQSENLENLLRDTTHRKIQITEAQDEVYWENRLKQLQLTLRDADQNQSDFGLR
jgi:hypothetical protein